jgi:hypothetical protein
MSVSSQALMNPDLWKWWCQVCGEPSPEWGYNDKPVACKCGAYRWASVPKGTPFDPNNSFVLELVNLNL